MSVFNFICKMPFLSSIIFLFISIIILLISRRVSRVICFSLSISSMFFLNYFIRSNNIFVFICEIILSCLIFGLYTFIQNKIKYDFTDRIISLTYIFNILFKPKIKNGEKIIGSVLPYNNYQLKYNGKHIIMNDISSSGSTLISGSVGSGKTFGMINLIKQNIKCNESVIFTEYKGEPKTTRDLIDFAKNYNFKVYILSPEENNFNYDPLQNLNNVGRIEALINMRKWSIDGSDAHYKTSVQLLLQKLVGDFSNKYNKDKNYTINFYNYVKSYHPNKDEWDAYSTTSKLLELLLTSSLKNIFAGKNKYDLNFNKIKNEKFLLIVSFVSSNKELATSFSSLLFRDLLDECTVVTPNKNINLYIDEFGTLENPFIIKDILEKGRSGKIATTLALQDINQIVIQTNEAYLNSILGIINTFIIYSGATRTTAEKFAGVQLLEIENILMNLRKPINNNCPTAIYISKYPTLNKKINSEVFRFEPFILKDTKQKNLLPKNDKSKYNEYNSNNELNSYEESNKKILNKINKDIESNKDIYDDFI